MQIQLVTLTNHVWHPDVVRLSKTLGYIPRDRIPPRTVHPLQSDAAWWKTILLSSEFGAIVDSEVYTDAGAITSNDRAQILACIDQGAEVFYITFVHRIDGHPVFFSLYHGGQLALSVEDAPYLASIGALLPA